ncbi:MAG TPA: trypsin-like peptidase domain-containing protein [Actinotalea sp.]|nr:trypsin-like peptidase domain-containing protein [Actinotalea sp.]
MSSDRDVQAPWAFAPPGGPRPQDPDGPTNLLPAADPPSAGQPAADPPSAGQPAADLPAADPPAAWAANSWGQPLPPVRERSRRRGPGGWLVPLLLVVAVVAGALGGVLGSRLSDAGRPDDAALPAGSERDQQVGQLTGVAAIAAEVLPSVVSIEVRGSTGEGTGSGFVIREDGYILTNNHVVSADVGPDPEIVVVLADGSEEPAEVVGGTSDYDLAVLKIDREGLTPLALGDSDAVVVGDPVVAIGAPLGLQGTVTTGIVSALNRPVSAGDAADTAFINAIQTDAAINPGNSGGPLVDAAGEVIGINSAIAQPPGLTQSAGSIGLGFAIPSNQARRTAEQLIETGTATYPVIGVLLDPTYTGEGVQVTTESQEGQAPVTPGGPADLAGIEAGDVILAIDGRPVTEADELIVAIRAKAPGDAVTLLVRSGRDEREVRVVLDELASD